MSPNTAQGVKDANARRNEARKRSIQIQRARREAEKREPELIEERRRQTLAEFWEREDKRQRRRRDRRARATAHSAWMKAGP